MELGLQDRVVIVTGAARGIGAAIADGFETEGAAVVRVDVGEAAGVRTCDVTSAEAVRSVVADVDAEYGRIDVLVNNAGILAEGPLETMDPALWQRTFDVNVTGVLHTCQAVIPVMKRARWGRILNAASFAAIVPSLGAAAYAASKAAVAHMSRTLAGELGAWGITVNSYAPGMVPTGMNHFADLDDDATARRLDQLTIRRWGTPEEIADALCFLASERAGYITGTMVDLSGGKFATQDPGGGHRAPYA